MSGATKKSAAQKLIDYYKCNEGRMDYKRYKTIGSGIIGSGATESAHRTVVQKKRNYKDKDGAKRAHKICSI